MDPAGEAGEGSGIPAVDLTLSTKARVASIGRSVLTAVAYTAAARVSVLADVGDQFQCPLWLPSGLALGLVLVWDHRIWPGLLAGAFLSGAWTLWDARAQTFVIFLGAICLAVGYVAEAVVTASLVRRVAAGVHGFARPQNVLRFAALAVAGSLLFGGSGETAALGLAGFGRQNPVLVWVNSWLGNALGMLVLTPLILSWSLPRKRPVEGKRLAEAAALLALLIGLCLVVFGKSAATHTRAAPVAFLIIPVLIWSALRFGQRGTTSVICVTACIAIVATAHGGGPFALAEMQVSMLLLQNYIAVLTVMSLVLAADVRQREQVETELRASEQRYRNVFEHNPLPMWLFDYESLRILTVNQAAVQDYGYSPADFCAMRLPELWPAKNKDELMAIVAEARKTSELRFDSRNVHKDGTVFEVNVTMRNLIFDGREAAVVLSEDISEQRRTDRQTAAFSDLARRLSAVSSAKEAVRMLMATADVLFGWDACIFELCSQDGQNVKTVLAVDTINGQRADVTADCRNESPGAHPMLALKEGARLILRPEPADFVPDMKPFGNHQRPSASLMFAPVRVENEAIAVLSVQSYRHNAYTDSDLRLFQTLADHCGSALKRVSAEEEIQRLNRELREHVEELETLFEVAPAGIAFAREADCRIITGNPAWARMMHLPERKDAEWTQAAASASGVRFLREGRELAPGELPMHTAARQGASTRQELQLVHPDGRRLTYYVAASPLFDDQGHVRGSLGVFVDLTELKKAEAALRESGERLRLALSAGRMGTWTADLRGKREVQISPELEKILGLNPGEFTGRAKEILGFVQAPDRVAVRTAIGEALRSEGDCEIEFRFVPRGGKPGWLFARGRAYGGAPGHPTRIAGVAMDITARRLADEEILRLNAELERRVGERTAQLEAINKELEAFSYSVSHDLRAPLRSIRGFSEVLLERYSEQLDARGQEFLRRACESSQHMDRLIEDLLKLSRVSRAELQQQLVDLSALAANITEELVQTHDNRPAVSISPRLKARGDERFLRIVLENLLRNAWKFSSKKPQPSVEFGFVAEPQPAFFVRDNGAGFDMAYASRLFGVFQRLHSASDFPGTGVGLATVQRIINRHGGRVWAEATPGQGATFYFTLPSDEQSS